VRSTDRRAQRRNPPGPAARRLPRSRQARHEARRGR